MPVDIVEELADGHPGQEGHRQDNVDGVGRLLASRHAPERQRRAAPDRQQQDGIAHVVAASQEGHQGEGDREQLVGEQDRQEEDGWLARGGRDHQLRPAAKCIDDAPDARGVGEEPGEAEHDGDERRQDNWQEGGSAEELPQGEAGRASRVAGRGDENGHGQRQQHRDRAWPAGEHAAYGHAEQDGGQGRRRCPVIWMREVIAPLLSQTDEADQRQQREGGDDDLGVDHPRGVDEGGRNGQQRPHAQGRGIADPAPQSQRHGDDGQAGEGGHETGHDVGGAEEEEGEDLQEQGQRLRLREDSSDGRLPPVERPGIVGEGCFAAIEGQGVEAHQAQDHRGGEDG